MLRLAQATLREDLAKIWNGIVKPDRSADSKARGEAVAEEPRGALSSASFVIDLKREQNDMNAWK